MKHCIHEPDDRRTSCSENCRNSDTLANQGSEHVFETVTVVLPLPPAVLSPNCPSGTRGGRFARAAAAKKYKRTAVEAAERQNIWETWRRATVQASFYHKTERRRDDVNHLAMLKPAYDGLVESGLLADDDSRHLTTLPAIFGVDRENPRVELHLTRLE